MLVFRLKDEDKEKVVTPFLKGEYSKVDRTYVERNFPANPLHPNAASRLVFDKSDITRKYWENLLQVSLPEGAEVWSKPRKNEEVYGYISDTVPDSSDNGEVNPEFIGDEELRAALQDIS